MLVATATGYLVWILAARLFPPNGLGTTSRLVTGGTLISGLVASGMGQYLLAAFPHLVYAERGRTVFRVVGLAIVFTAVFAAVVGVALFSDLGLQGIVLLSLVAVTVTTTTIQDAVYVAAERAFDIPAKAVSIGLGKIGALVGFGLLAVDLRLDNYQWLICLLVVPQLIIVAGWIAFRLPRSIVSGPRFEHALGERPRAMLPLGYLYALAGVAIAWGMPTVVTSTLGPDDAALFYVAWIVATVIGGVSVALANALVGSGTRSTPRHFAIIMVGQALVSASMTIAIVLLASRILEGFGTFYQGSGDFVAWVAIGQFFSGTTAVLIAFLRLQGRLRHVSAGIMLWLLGGFVVPAAAVVLTGDARYISLYPVSSAVGTVLVSMLVVRPFLRRQLT